MRAPFAYSVQTYSHWDGGPAPVHHLHVSSFFSRAWPSTLGVSGRGDLWADAANTLASGTKLYVRLEAAVSTQTSHLNQAVNARVVRDITTDQGVLVPIGAEVTGTIEKLIPTSDPTDHARLLIHFTQLAIPHHPALSLNAHLTEVENAREMVLQDGTIQGVLEKDAAVGRMDGLLDKLGTPGSEMEKVSGKAIGKADTSIAYPAGTDLTLTLDHPLAVDSTFAAGRGDGNLTGSGRSCPKNAG